MGGNGAGWEWEKPNLRPQLISKLGYKILIPTQILNQIESNKLE